MKANHFSLVVLTVSALLMASCKDNLTEVTTPDGSPAGSARVAATTAVPEGVYELVSATDNASVLTSKQNPNRVILRPNSHQPTQQWALTKVNSKVNDGRYNIAQVINDNDVNFGAILGIYPTASLPKIMLYPEFDASVYQTQTWVITSAGDGYFRIQPTDYQSGSLAVSDFATNSEIKVQIGKNNNTTFQKWKLVLVQKFDSGNDPNVKS